MDPLHASLGTVFGVVKLAAERDAWVAVHGGCYRCMNGMKDL